VAWLSLDAGDNDPARFWRHVAATLDGARPGVAERVAGLLGPPAPTSFEGLVTALINQLDAHGAEHEVLLVLDDYHLVDALAVHASLEFLLEHLPAGLRLVLTSRSDPPLPLARLRARGELAELRAAELRFTTEEAGELLRQATGSDLPDAAVSTLAARTEGWAAGLQLAALSLQGQVDAAGFVATFSGSHRYVLDYLAEEVLDRQPELLRSFLLETSVLERLSGPLCDAVTRRSDGQAMLEQVERANLFLVPLDEVRGWWRYHQLFADLLRARLRQHDPDRVPQLHRAAAGWFERHGLADDAVRHALAAGDSVWAVRLVERYADELLLRGEGATLSRWLGSLPADLIGGRPRMLLAEARLALLGGRVDGAEDLLDAAERAAADGGGMDEPYEPSVGWAASLLANVPATIALNRTYLAELRGDGEGAVAFARRALEAVGQDEWMLASHANGYLGVAQWLCGRLGDADACCRRPSPSGDPLASAPWPSEAATTSARSSEPRAAWTRPSGLTTRPSSSPPHPVDRPSRLRASRMWAWPRWPTSGGTWTPPCDRSPRASRWAASSRTPSRWPTAWPPWPGSGRPKATPRAPWTPSARPSTWRPARV
jgi:LuxR family transcriptional regulator, maltose regulon positive regulatory protein